MTPVEALRSLRLRTSRLELRLGSRSELLELGRLAKQGIHPPAEMPFTVAWTDRAGEPTFVEDVAEHHESRLSAWSPDAWSLNLLVWEAGSLAGVQELFASAFSERRVVGTASWLGRAVQGRGIGIEMRTAVLELAFRGLGAVRAESAWLEGNHASRRVSEKLGYVPIANDRRTVRNVPVPHHHVALERDAWAPTSPVEIVGLEECRALFGVSEAPSEPR